MGYYCTVPQCTSLAGKTKNVKFHRFPRDVNMADKWNVILKRGKPYTKYSKVCSLHFTQSDYNVTTMGQWKTLSKDAVPSQNLPRLNADGTVMVIRKSRTVKYKEGQTVAKKEENNIAISDKVSAWPLPHVPPTTHLAETDAVMSYHPSNVLTSIMPPQNPNPSHPKPKKQDAIMQTDPIDPTDEEETPTNTSSETSEHSFTSDTVERYQYPKEPMVTDQKSYETPKDYTKNTEDYVPQTNEEYNKEAEKYALERKPNYEKHSSYDKAVEYQKSESFKNREGYDKLPEMYQKEGFVQYSGHAAYEKGEGFAEGRTDPFIQYQTSYVGDSADILRNQQHNLQMLQQHRGNDSQTFFNENHIKQEIEIETRGEEDKYPQYGPQRHLVPDMQDGSKPVYYEAQVKTEPQHGCDSAMQSQGSPYYPGAPHGDTSGYYAGDMCRPGPELLIAKQNALAAHTQLWQNTMKRPFFYSESPHYNGSQLLHSRYEDLTRILNQ